MVVVTAAALVVAVLIMAVMAGLAAVIAAEAVLVLEVLRFQGKEMKAGLTLARQLAPVVAEAAQVLPDLVAHRLTLRVMEVQALLQPYLEP